jgi:hypothetical protein
MYILLAFLAIVSNAKTYATMEAKALPRTNYTPNMKINSAYETFCKVTQRIISAKIEITTKVPALNLDNFMSISNVDCSQSNKIQVTFKSAKSVSAATNQWAATPDLALFMSHAQACLGKPEAQAFAVQSMRANGLILDILTKPMKVENVIDEYHLQVTQSPLSPAQLARRNIFNWHGTVGKKFHYSLNFDPATQTTPIPSIGFDSPAVSAYCKNCYTHGNTTISLDVHATFLTVKSYNLKINGGFWGTVDLEIDVPATHNTFRLQKILATVDLTPIQVPGVFSFGPEIQLRAGISYSVAESVHLSYGFDVALPFDVDVSGKGLFSNPTISMTFNPKLNQHELFRTKDIHVGVAAHLIPSIGFDLKIFKIEPASLTLTLDSSIGMDFNVGKSALCPWDITMYQEHVASFNSRLLAKRWNPITCLHCSACKPGLTSPSTTSLAVTTTIAPITAATTKVSITVFTTTTSMATTTVFKKEYYQISNFV